MEEGRGVGGRVEWIALRGGLRVEAVPGIQAPTVDGDTLRAPPALLRLDAQLGAVGESLASPLLLPEEGGSPWMRSLARSYKARAAREEYSELELLLGEALRLVHVPPEALLLLRARKTLAPLHPCAAAKGLDSEGLALLRRAVTDALGSSTPEGPPPSRVAAGGAVAARIASKLSFLAPVSGLGGSGCRPPRHVLEPWRLFKAPEGSVVLEGCGPPPECMCRAPSAKSSSVICSCRGRKLVYKDYFRVSVKWVAVSPVYAPVYPLRVRPHARAGAEYRWLVELRHRGFATPRVERLCSSHLRVSMLRGFLEGDTLEDRLDKDYWRLGGELLAAVHAAGASLGDPNPGNLVPSKWGVIDAEQAAEYTPERGAWDVAAFAAYSLAVTMSRPGLVEAFLEGYSGGGDVARLSLEVLRRPGFAFKTPLALAPAAARLLAGLLRRLSR